MMFGFKKKGKKAGAGSKGKKFDSGHYKNGIRRIQSDDEIAMAFTDEGVSPVSSEVDSPAEPLQQLSVEKTPEKMASGKIQRDKHGFPVLDHAEDLAQLLDSSEVSEKNGDVSNDRPRKPVGDKKKLKTKHGIPILHSGEDFFSAFKEPPGEEDFNEILSESLGEKTLDVLLKEKTDRVGPKKQFTEKQRLARYPLPQGQIDLHGYTARWADLKADSFIKKAFYSGMYTIRIIVGKGLHSPDGPVLPDIIEKRVIQLKNEEIVFAYEWDRKQKFKSGAIIVFLNNYHRQAES